MISTAHVPPQQRDWWGEEVLATSDPMKALPLEISGQIIDLVDDFPISLERAKKFRAELMDERRADTDMINAHLAEETFSFCEH